MFLTTSQAIACDDLLKTVTGDPVTDQRLNKDCQIQDRFSEIREQFKTKHNINVNDISEYKVMRFVDRFSWEKAKTNQKKISQIYHPAPITWEIWSLGLDQIFQPNTEKNRLDQARYLEPRYWAFINYSLLTDGTRSSKDQLRSDPKKQPGEYRLQTDGRVGFCATTKIDYRNMIEKSKQSMQVMQNKWEDKSLIRFSDLLLKNRIPQSHLIDFGTTMELTDIPCPGTQSSNNSPTNSHQKYWVAYAPSELVTSYLLALKVFMKTNLEFYKNKQIIMSPIEFSAFVQKWFVTIHPFADGNGRTSRAIQDMILEHFDLPFAPAGDLQNDALEEYDTYITKTYESFDKMLTTLEGCLQKYNTGSEIPRECQTVHSNIDK